MISRRGLQDIWDGRCTPHPAGLGLIPKTQWPSASQHESTSQSGKQQSNSHNSNQAKTTDASSGCDSDKDEQTSHATSPCNSCSS
eukprot:6676613-Karenia_brevis.AAC.1